VVERYVRLSARTAERATSGRSWAERRHGDRRRPALRRRPGGDRGARRTRPGDRAHPVDGLSVAVGLPRNASLALGLPGSRCGNAGGEVMGAAWPPWPAPVAGWRSRRCRWGSMMPRRRPGGIGRTPHSRLAGVAAAPGCTASCVRGRPRCDRPGGTEADRILDSGGRGAVGNRGPWCRVLVLPDAGALGAPGPALARHRAIRAWAGPPIK
jgi:hypothetical protein